MKKNHLPLLAVLLLMLAASCGDQSTKEKVSNPENFQSYINGYTSGMIPTKSPVVISLKKEITTATAGGELPGKVFSFSPSIKGTAFLVDPHTIEFRPDQALLSGRKYKATFDLGNFFDVKPDLSTFTFDFSVIPQDFTVYRGRLVNAGSDQSGLKRYEGKMITADDMTLAAAQDILSVNSPRGKLDIKVTGNGPREFTYVIDSIPRREQSYTISLQWDGKKEGINKTGKFDVTIPSVYDFSLLSVDVDQSASNQHISLVFSDPVDDAQSLDGLISIRDVDNIRLSRKGNEVIIYPQSRLYGEKHVIIERAVRNQRGQELDRRQDIIVAMEALKPEVQIIGQGVIMPDSRNLTLSFKAVSLRAVDVIVYKIFADNLKQFFQFNNYEGESNLKYVGRPAYRTLVRLDENPDLNLQQWNAFSVDLSKLVEADPHAMYRVKFAFTKDYAAYECNGSSDEERNISADIDLFDSKQEKAYWDGNRNYWYNYPNNYNWRDRDNPCTDSYYISSRFPERNLLASNLGLLAKSADNRHFTVAVTDLLTTAPVTGATLEFYNLQQQLLGSVTTGDDGFGKIILDDVPYLMMAKKEGEQSWLRLDDGTSLSVSNFDVSGEAVQEGIKGMIYGERGVWRPGDTLFLTFVMDDVEQRLPADQPVVFDLYNARGQKVFHKVKTQGNDGFYTFRPVTDAEAPTGNWSAQVQVGGASFSKRLKVETIKPNRLKIDLTFNQKILTSKPGLRGNLKVKWLHGAPASNLKARVEVKLINTDYAFEGYKKFVFSDPTKYFYPKDYTVFDGQLDAQGAASFPIDMKVNHNAPGMLKAVFDSRVFEKGGNFSTDVFSKPFAPYDRFVGIRVPDGGDYRHWLNTDTTHTIEVVTVDPEGKPVSVDGLQVRIYHLAWRWWWSSGSNNMASWIRSEDSEQVLSKTFSTTDGHANLQFKIEYPDWGRYFIHVLDPNGGHSTGIPVYVDWPSSVARGDRVNPAGATVLNFSSDKEKYAPGQTAVISFPSAEGSRALVSIESGSAVLEQWWVNGNEGNTDFSFKITPEMAPNVYVNLTLLQPHAQTANDLPIRMYGVIPLMVEDPGTRLQPLIAAPDEIRPETDYNVSVSEQNGRPMTYTLAVVDEGLLDLTRFKTPHPWDHFYAREALGVKSWDLFDEVLGAYGGRIQKVLAIGGDQAGLNQEDRKANRFKPVVTFLGPFQLKKGETATHRLHMPNYIGSVRVMVVAGHDGAWGSAQQDVPVRQPLMVLATAPRVIGPGESFDLPVTVFAMNEKIRRVDIKLTVESPLTTTDGISRQVDFENIGEKMAYFRIGVKEMEGIGKIRVEAVSGNETSFAEIELQVRNPNPVTTRTETYILKAGEEKQIPYAYHGMKGTNAGSFEVSGLPSLDLEKKLRYLMRYPYGCVEQVTSSVFPQLYLGNILELTTAEQERISKNIRAGIRKLSRFQQADGSMAYWPGSSYASDWGTTYAGHFLLMAERKGYLIPFDMRQKWIKYQNQVASTFDNSPHSNSYWHTLAQAYRLYSLALAGEPNMSAMNRLRNRNHLSAAVSWRLAAAYQLAGMPEVADEMVKDAGFDDIHTYETAGFTFGSRLRDQAMILETLTLMDKRTQAFELLNKIAQEARNGYFSTQTAAFVLIAYGEFLGDENRQNEIRISYDLNGEQKTVHAQTAVYRIQLDTAAGEGTLTLKNSGDSELFVTKTISGQPLYGDEQDASRNLKINVKYIGMEGDEMDVSKIRQGYDFEAVVDVTNPGAMGSVSNLALSQIFPAGWEIRNLRLNDEKSLKHESAYDYRDIRDDRVYTFFDLAAGRTATFRVSLNAAYSGKYYLPATSCEAMYDGNIYARRKGQWVEVIKSNNQ